MSSLSSLQAIVFLLLVLICSLGQLVDLKFENDVETVVVADGDVDVTFEEGRTFECFENDRCVDRLVFSDNQIGIDKAVLEPYDPIMVDPMTPRRDPDGVSAQIDSLGLPSGLMPTLLTSEQLEAAGQLLTSGHQQQGRQGTVVDTTSYRDNADSIVENMYRSRSRGAADRIDNTYSIDDTTTSIRDIQDNYTSGTAALNSTTALVTELVTRDTTMDTMIKTPKRRVYDAHIHIWSDGKVPYGWVHAPPEELHKVATYEALRDVMKRRNEGNQNTIVRSLSIQPANHMYDHAYLHQALIKPGDFLRGMFLCDPGVGVRQAKEQMSSLVKDKISDYSTNKKSNKTIPHGKFSAFGGARQSEDEASSGTGRSAGRSFVGIRFNPLLFPDKNFESSLAREMFAYAGELDLVVGVMAFTGILAHMEGLKDMIAESPGTRVIIDHFGFFRQEASGGIREEPHRLINNISASETLRQVFSKATTGGVETNAIVDETNATTAETNATVVETDATVVEKDATNDDETTFQGRHMCLSGAIQIIDTYAAARGWPKWLIATAKNRLKFARTIGKRREGKECQNKAPADIAADIAPENRSPKAIGNESKDPSKPENGHANPFENPHEELHEDGHRDPHEDLQKHEDDLHEDLQKHEDLHEDVQKLPESHIDVTSDPSLDDDSEDPSEVLLDDLETLVLACDSALSERNIEDGFEALLSLAAFPSVHVKASGTFRVSKLPFPHGDLRARVWALLDHFGANRVLWGSDFPFLLLGGHSRNSFGVASPVEASQMFDIWNLMHEDNPMVHIRSRDIDKILFATANTLFY